MIIVELNKKLNSKEVQELKIELEKMNLKLDCNELKIIDNKDVLVSDIINIFKDKAILKYKTNHRFSKNDIMNDEYFNNMIEK